MAERVTLRDIAKEAGVHHTTVSLALRNHASLPQKTRTRIQKVAERMGYRPDPMLSALSAYKSSKVGAPASTKIALVTNLENSEGQTHQFDFFNRTFNGAKKKAQSLGFDLDVFNMSDEGLSYARMEKILLTRNIQGLVLAYFRSEDDIQLDWEQFSAVKVEHLPLVPKLNVICSNQMQAAHMALEKLKAKGYKRIAPILNEWTDLKLGHYYSAGVKAYEDLFDPEDRIKPCYFSDWDDLTGKLEEYLAENKPDAILSDWNHAVVNVLNDLGYRVPDDIGFASLSLREGEDMSGVVHSYEKVGSIAVDVVAQMLRSNERGLPDVSCHTLVDGSWHDGSTLSDLT